MLFSPDVKGGSRAAGVDAELLLRLY